MNQGAPKSSVMDPIEKIYPSKVGLKYDPPSLCLLYNRHPKDKKKKLYQIFLHGLTPQTNADELTKLLFIDHAAFLNERNVTFEQVRSLVSKLVTYKKTNSGPIKRVSEGKPPKDPKAAVKKETADPKWEHEADFDNFDSMNNKNVRTLHGDHLFSGYDEGDNGTGENPYNGHDVDFEGVDDDQLFGMDNGGRLGVKGPTIGKNQPPSGIGKAALAGFGAGGKNTQTTAGVRPGIGGNTRQVPKQTKVVDNEFDNIEAYELSDHEQPL